MAEEIRRKLTAYQDRFVFSSERYSALVCGVGTGKTWAQLLRCYKHCVDYPGSLGLVVRRVYRDLRDSTVRDFEDFFSAKLDGNQDYRFGNGSALMFRHGDMVDINKLKNLNLSFFAIEQAEEYETAEVFDFLRDRLRRGDSPRWGSLVANAAGHNWIWERFIAGADCRAIDAETGQWDYRKAEYMCCTASTFAAQGNLPADFVADLRRMETEVPEHYRQYVLNDFNADPSDDLLFARESLEKSGTLEFPDGAGPRVAGLDVARYGKDRCVLTVLEQKGYGKWAEVTTESWSKASLTETAGKVLDLMKRLQIDAIAIDSDGLGAGVTDLLRESKHSVLEFHGGLPAGNDREFFNVRAEAYWRLKYFVDSGLIKFADRSTLEELAMLTYAFDSRGRKQIVSKDALRRKGIRSPDYADALMMAAWAAERGATAKDDLKLDLSWVF